MKVSYRVAGGGAGYTPLADDASGQWSEEFQPQFGSVQLDEPAFGSGGKVRRPQGNVECSMPLAWDQIYADPATALAGVRTTAGLMDQLLHFKYEEGTETQYYPNAMVTNYTPKLSGRSVRHALQFSSDNVTNTAPA